MQLSALALLAQIHPAPPRLNPQSHDVLILRSGDAHKGLIKVCDSDSCTLGTVPYTREVIAWIGLATDSVIPPAVKDASEDEVHLRDGSIEKGHLVGLSLGEVDIEGDSFDRENVEWIHLAGALVAPPQTTTTTITTTEGGSGGKSGGDKTTGGGSGGGGGGGDKGKQGSSSGGGSSGGSAGDKGTQGSSGDHPKPGGQRGHLWSGQIHVRTRVTTSDSGSSMLTEQETDITAHLREFISPLIRPPRGERYGTIIDLEPEGTEIHTDYTVNDTFTSGGNQCHGSGNLTLTLQPGQEGYGRAQWIWINDAADDTTPWIGFPIVRGKPRYILDTPAPSADKFSVDCHSWTVDAGGRKEYSHTKEQPFGIALIGKNPLTGCAQPVCDPEVRTIDGASGRMHGAFHRSWDENGFHHERQVRWSLCRDDVPCKDEPPEPETNPCGGTAIADGLLQVCENEEVALINKMNSKWSEYQKTRREADPHQSDFVKAMLACTGWDAAQLALEVIMAADIPLIGAEGEVAAEAKEVKEQLELINKFMKALYNGDPLALAKKPAELKNLQMLAEAVKQFVELYHLDQGNAEAFLEKLDQCNAPLSQETISSAQSYILTMARAFEQFDEYSKIVNDLRSKNDECLKKQWDAYVACVQTARCQKTPESACDSRRPPGDWPDVPE